MSKKPYDRILVVKGEKLEMGKGSKSGAYNNNCKSSSHKMFKDKAKNRVDDLQGMFADLQYARKESRTTDVAVLEEQVHQMLREWKAELNEPTPASSIHQGESFESFSDIYRLLHLNEEEDDATSKLASLKPEPDAQNVQAGNNANNHEGFILNQLPQEQNFPLLNEGKSLASEVGNVNVFQGPTELDLYQFHVHQDFDQDFFTGYGVPDLSMEHMQHITDFMANTCLPPSAFLGPKCALWDCPRPAHGLDWYQDYCSSFHAVLALNEGPPGMTPVLRPGGIGLKDGLLFAALSAKALGKDVGIPECEGAATSKSPWNAPELFDLLVLEGETIREWLFFDKPRRAFESGNRKQRSLPDYNGRGWHESRKQDVKEHGGLKRSYYMDPQPHKQYEWHLYEYEINRCDICALYRLEYKTVDGKKVPKGKIATDSVADLQKQMGRLSAEVPLDNKGSNKGKTRFSSKDRAANVRSATNQVAPVNGLLDYGLSAPYNYLVDNLDEYFLA